MKKAAALLTIFLLLAATQAAWAGRQYHHRYRGHHHHHHRHYHGGSWAVWGVGVLTGSLVTYLAYPRPFGVAVAYPAPVAVHPRPVVIERRTTAVIPPAGLGATTARVSVGLLNVRSGPGMEHAVVDLARLGDRLAIVGSVPGWYCVRTEKGRYGWVMERFTSTETPLG